MAKQKINKSISVEIKEIIRNIIITAKESDMVAKVNNDKLPFIERYVCKILIEEFNKGSYKFLEKIIDEKIDDKKIDEFAWHFSE